MEETQSIDFMSVIDPRKLPEGWTATQEYDTSVYIRSPKGRPEEVIVMVDETGTMPVYTVMPMGRSVLSGATSESVNEYADSFTVLENAIAYAVETVVPMLDSGSY
jgi:hypothetical protein